MYIMTVLRARRYKESLLLFGSLYAHTTLFYICSFPTPSSTLFPNPTASTHIYYFNLVSFFQLPTTLNPPSYPSKKMVNIWCTPFVAPLCVMLPTSYVHVTNVLCTWDMTHRKTANTYSQSFIYAFSFMRYNHHHAFLIYCIHVMSVSKMYIYCTIHIADIVYGSMYARNVLWMAMKI